MRLLLDEGFPSPPGFRPESVDARTEVVALRQFDATLAGSATPDWYLYLRAEEAGFDALVTQLAADLGISTQQVRDQAKHIIDAELGARAEHERFRAMLD